MRLIHTADWHLGRLFHNVHLTHDQRAVLEQFVALVAEVRPAAVIVAGDLYDRSVPPTDAVELLDDVLTELVAGLGVSVITIAGNHDSPTRVGFGGALLRDKGLHMVGRLQPGGCTLRLADEHGPVHVHALPFADPAEARAVYADASIHDQQAALAAGVALALRDAPLNERHIAVAHAFVAGGLESESERPLSVGGIASVASNVFSGFDYVALGHLHRPQAAGTECVRYAGSLMKYSFAEHDHVKAVNVVEIGAPGSAPDGRARVGVEQVALSPPRDARRVTGLLADLLVEGRADPRSTDYIEAVLLDKGAILDAIGQLREVYPNVLLIDRPALEASAPGDEPRPDPRETGDAELFERFFAHVCGAPPSQQQAAAFAAVVDALRGRDREAVT